MFKLQHWSPFVKMTGMIDRFRSYCEKRGFEVCSRLGDRIGISPSVVRMYFIYGSFIALGFPFILYLFLAFWVKIKDYTKSKRTSVLDI